jgi:hypothetical protein
MLSLGAGVLTVRSPTAIVEARHRLLAEVPWVWITHPPGPVPGGGTQSSRAARRMSWSLEQVTKQ